MEMFSLYAVIFSAVLCLSIYYFFSARSFKNGSKLPPGSHGWPFLGENVAFLASGPQEFIQGRMKKYCSDVFRTSLMGQNVAVFGGTAGNKFFFSNETKLLTPWVPPSVKKAVLFPEYVEKSVKEIAAMRRGFYHDILKPEALKEYIPIMDSMAREHIKSEWEPHKQLKVFPVFKKYSFPLGCKIFMNVEDPERVKKLADMLTMLITGMLAVPINLPGFAYYRAINGGKMLREELVRIIRERRKELEKLEDKKGLDFLSKILLLERSFGDDDESLAEMEICNNIMALLMASHDTTTIAVVFTIKYLAELPHVYDQVYKEQMEIKRSKGPGESLTWEDIQKMEYSWNVARETLRLAPPLIGSFREAVSDFTYAGFTVPKGWKTFWTTHSTHRNPKYFADPETFEPRRFEGNGVPPFAFVPFGGGPKMCPGKEYARMEILIFMHHVVTKFKLEKLEPREKILFHSSPHPTKGVPVRLHPHVV